jgi:hypothetical protein
MRIPWGCTREYVKQNNTYGNASKHGGMNGALLPGNLKSSYMYTNMPTEHIIE